MPARTNPWLIAFAVVVPTFMEVLDTTVANVALRYISGGLSAAQTDSEWVITSYLAANAIVLPITGWLSAHLGRRRYFLLSIAVFTVASVLCGLSTSLGMLIGCRVLQGLAGGGLQPSSQAILLDSFPPEKQGSAQTLFGIAALLAPVIDRIKELAGKYIHPDGLTVIVGGEAKEGEPALEKLGPVTVYGTDLKVKGAEPAVAGPSSTP